MIAKGTSLNEINNETSFDQQNRPMNERKRTRCYSHLDLVLASFVIHRRSLFYKHDENDRRSFLDSLRVDTSRENYFGFSSPLERVGCRQATRTFSSTRKTTKRSLSSVTSSSRRSPTDIPTSRSTDIQRFRHISRTKSFVVFGTSKSIDSSEKRLERHLQRTTRKVTTKKAESVDGDTNHFKLIRKFDCESL